MRSSRKYPYLPHRRDSSQHLPTPLEIPVKLYIFLSIIWSQRTPLPPRKFQSLLCWGGGRGEGVWIFFGTAPCELATIKIWQTAICCLE